jgi:tetratricopeptide (TPR) repeat protein
MVPLAEARHSLATALSILRPRLGPDGLETDRDQVLLNGQHLALDLDRLLRGEVLGTETTAPLEVAAFLDGFEIPDAGEFSLWKDRQQARLLPAIKSALIVLIDRCRRTGDSRQIEQLADRMLALDDLSEEAIRAKMEARAFAGDRLTALKLFEEWKAKLAEAVGAVPTELLEGMAVRLRRRGWERTESANVPPVPTDQWRGRPFIGRGSDYALLYDAWEAVKKGSPGHTLVLGDSGIGKTTLVERFTTAAGLEGAAISRVQCYEVEREIPYTALVTLMHGLLERPGVSATSPEALAELSRTAPEVRRRFPAIPECTESQGETARIRLTESFLEMLHSIADEHPVILVADDVHQADDATLAVLHAIMRRSRGLPLMVLLAARPGDLLQSPQAAKLRESRGDVSLREIELAPLEAEDSKELLESLLAPTQSRPNASVRRSILKAASGFPIVLEFLVQDWASHGNQALALGIDAMTTEFGTKSPPPAAYRQMLDRIIAALDSTAHTVLDMAALLGRRLNDLSMYVLADLTTAQAVTGMSALVARRVLRDAGNRLEFVNELVRTAAYLGIPSPARRVLHERIAERFVKEEASSQEPLGLEIAWHYTRAGRAIDATPYLLRGAKEALRKGALHVAEKGLSTALPNLLADDRHEAAVLLAEILQEQGRWSESLGVLAEQGLDLSDDRVKIMITLAEHLTTTATSNKILSEVLRLKGIVVSGVTPSVRIKAARAAARLMVDLRDDQLARQLLSEVENIPTTALVEHDLLEHTLSRAQLLYHARDCKASFESVSALAARIANRDLVSSTVGSLHSGLGAIHCATGKYHDAKREFHRAFEIFVRLGNETSQQYLSAQLALCCGRLGEYVDQIEWAKRGGRHFGPTFIGYNEVQVAYYTAFGLAMRGENSAAIQAVTSLDNRIPATAPAWLLQAWKLSKADVFYLCGQHATSFSVARDALDYPHSRLHSRSFAGGFARWLALVARNDHRESEAALTIEELRHSSESLDALDQVEVLCAASLVSGSSVTHMDLRQQISTKLAALPVSVAEQLKRLGVLQP